MRLQTKIAAAVLMGVCVAFGLSMIEHPPEKASAEIRWTAAMAITGIELLENAGLRVVDNIAAGLRTGRWMKRLFYDSAATSGNGTSVEWDRHRIARRTGRCVCIDRVTITNTEIVRHLHHSIRSGIVGMQTHMCLEAATRAAADFGYRVTVVGDACATRDLEYGGTTVPAAQVHDSTLASLNGAYAQVVSLEDFLKTAE